MTAIVLRGGTLAQQFGAELPPASALRAWMETTARVLKRNRHSAVGLVDLGGQWYYLKLYQSKSVLQGLWFRLGHGRAVHSYDAAAKLQALGMPVPAPLGCLRLGSQLLLLQQGIDGAVDLNQHWLEGLAPQQQRAWMRRCGDVLGQLHRQGYVHGDAKWTNLLCQGEALWLVDLDGVRPGGSPAQARDLARFTLNAEDRTLAPADYEVFLQAYLAHTGGDREGLLAAIRPPLRKLRRRHVKQYGARGRRLLD